MTGDARIGVDIGGTFTDVVTVAEGDITVTKTPSTPDAPEHGVVDGLDMATDRAGIKHTAIRFLAHGTTVPTNAVLERTWADTALVTTAGFRDALEIGRGDRPALYDLRAEKADPVVERDRRYEVTERLDEHGEVVTGLDEASIQTVVDDIAAAHVESVAVSLLFSFENDDHERRVGESIEDALEVSVSLSSQVLPEIREYERTLATSLNAALKPVMDLYVGALEGRLADRDVPAELKIMQSNGGIITADVARERPVRTLLSGPAAGVQGAAHVAAVAGVDDVITMDMGGTSCDVSLVRDGDPVISTEVTVGEYPVRVPMVDIHTIGAGGGSVAWIDAGDALRVGPRSAGAEPGPICYGRGGTEPTVTDAQLLLGRLRPATFVEDAFDVDIDAVEAGIRERVAEPLGLSVDEAAQGIVDVANANMERALRVVSVERGHDPREFGLVAFGGAGPLHAAELAAALDIPRVMVPRTAGVLSALGLLISDVIDDYSTSRVRPLRDIDPADLQSTLKRFERHGVERLAAENVPESDRRFERAVDLRYEGQSFDLTVPVPDGEIDASTLADIEDRFHAAHERRYGHASPDEPIELVTIRLRARGVVDPPDLTVDGPTGSVADARIEDRSVTFDGDAHETAIYERARLPVDGTFDGPAVVEGPESTIVVPPATTARIDPFGNVVLEVGP